MRSSGGCTIQQALTAEAASVVNQAINLARRRGHAQVTPLHVASTMLSSSSGLLRTACLQSHSHPLQCRALELCFNVALNRLPTSTASSTSPMLMGAINPSSHSQRPAISNALVAAFKRAQAHQRRGSVENQQQPILVVKIDLQQLIISILDDPSVSRVMKEAGFSSPLVKDKVEQAQVSSSKDVHNSNKDDYEDSSSNKKKPPPPPPKVDHTNNSMDDDDSNTASRQQHDHHELGSSTLGFGLVQQEAVKQRRKISDDQSVIIRKEDITSLIDSLMMRNSKRSKRSHVVVGECVATLEGVVRGAKDQLEKGARPLSSPSSSSSSYDENDHHHHHHHQGSNCAVKFVPVSLHSFVHLTRQQVEQQILQLKCLVNKCRTEENNRVILYLGDLKWCIDFRADSSINYKNYCPVEHMIVELGRLVSDYYDSGRLWLIGIATFQTYIRCKTASTRSGQYSSLETIWGLHPITIPSGSLALSLFPADSSSDIQSPSVNKKGGDHGGSSWLLVDNSSIGGNQDKSVGANCLLDGVMTTTTPIMCTETPTSSPRLPSWLQQCKGDINSLINANQDPAVPAAQVCKRWNSFNGGGGHHEATTSQSSFERTLSFSSISPLNSSPSYDHQHPFFKLQHQHRHLQEPNNFSTNNSFFCISNYDVPPSSTSNRSSDPPTTVLTMHIHQQDDAVQRQRGFVSSSISPNNSTPKSATCSSDMIIMECSPPSPRFKKYNVTNLDTLCRALEEKVPRQKDILPEIASTVLHCRSGTGRRRSSGSNHVGLPNHHHRHNKKEETWLLFQGLDVDAKVKIAEELARLVFGSQEKFVSIPLSSLSSPSTRTSDFLEDHNSSCSPTKPSVRSKRLRDEQSCRSCIERFAEAMSSDPHRVFFVEGVDQVDYCSQMDLKKAIERGKLTNRNDEEVGLGDAIVILSCESCFISPRSRDCSPCFKMRHDIMDLQTKAGVCVCDGLEEERSANNYASPSLSLDLNISIDDDQEEVDHNTSTVDNVGLVASVDRCVMFKI